MTPIPISLGRRSRETPFEKRVFEHNPKSIAIYNHMTIPTLFESLEADYTHLCEHVQLWDVSCERQVEIRGPDALKLVELATPRDLSDMQVGQGRYAPLVDERGGILNDPIIQKLAEDRFWVSIADSDVLLWFKGLAVGLKLDVLIFEPDVSPLALQGPRAEDLLAEIVGEHVRDIKFFWFIEEDIAGIPVLISRSGWSGQGGFEIYLQGHDNGIKLWDALFEPGRKYKIRAGCPNLIERLEAGLLSYGNDMTLANNPFECGLDKFFKLGKKAPYIGRLAIEQIAKYGATQKLVRLMIHHNAPIAMRSTLPVIFEGEVVGFVTSQAHSNKYQAVLSMAYIAVTALESSADFEVRISGNERLRASVRDDKWGVQR